MAKHFISVLGTGLYEPVQYSFEGAPLGKYEFIQAALIHHFQSELENGGKVSVFLTKGARKKNWENRLYDENDKTSAGRWKSSKKNNVIAGELKHGLKEYLANEFGGNFAIEGVPIEDASTESQIWSVFQTIYDKIENDDEIIFDITHSFRSIPMLAITIINFARIMKNCRVYGIYYGAYEANETDGIAPIIDLTVYNDILQWTSATDTFIRYGKADQIKQLYFSKKDQLNKNTSKSDIQKEAWNKLKNIITAMSTLSDTLATCRGIDASKIDGRNKTKPSKSIRCAYQKFKQETDAEKNYSELIKEIVPLHQLLDKAKENYQPFDKEQDYMIGCEVIRWSIQSGMTQQGYTALEETVKTYLCYIYDIDNRSEQNRDGKIGAILNAFVQFLKNYHEQVTEENQYTSDSRIFIKKYIEEEDDSTSELYENSNSEWISKLNEIVWTLPIELAQISNKIKVKRNDINHFGFNQTPSSADNLKSDLVKLFEEFETFVKEKTPELTERIKIYRSNSPQ